MVELVVLKRYIYLVFIIRITWRTKNTLYLILIIWFLSEMSGCTNQVHKRILDEMV